MFFVNNFHHFSGLFLSLTSMLQVIGGIIPLGEITPADPKFPVGDNLTLTCNLTNYLGPLNSSSLYFISGRNETDSSPLIPSQFYSVVSPTAVRLTIPFVKHKHQNFYRCFINDTSRAYVASKRVRIGSPPDVINAIEVVSRSLRDLNVTWCTKNIKQDLTTYHLSWTSTNWGSMESCPEKVQTGSQCYTCMWREVFFFEGTYHLVIRGSSIYGNSTSNFTINATEHVKPDPVSSLVIEPLNSTSVRAKWKRPSGLTDLLHLNYTLTSMKNPHSPLKSVVVKEVEEVVLGDFHPGSIYTFGIRCIPEIGGIFSNETETDFKMPDDVPATAPESPLGWFHSPWCMDGVTSILCLQNSTGTCLNITFYWQPIPEHLRNGEILGYRLQYEDPNGNHSSHVNSTSGQVLLALHKNHVLHLSAFTSAGPSVMRSIVFQSNCNEMPKPLELFAERTLDKRGVVIQWSRVDGATNYSLLYCRGKDKSCSGEPMLKVISPDQTNITLLNITEHIFALAVNTERGTSGLSWICLFDYDGRAFDLKAVNVENTEVETELIVKWDPVTCDEFPSSGKRPGRVLNYTVTYGVTGSGEETSLVVPGNTTQCSIRGLSVGSNYTISVYGSTRTGPGKAMRVFHLLNPANLGGSGEVLYAAVIPCFVILIIIAIWSIRRWYRAYWQLPITPPKKFDLESSQPECQENENYTTSVEGYAVISKDPTQPFLGYKSGQESIEYKQPMEDTELTWMFDFNHNVSPCFKTRDCSYQSGKSSMTSTPLEESKGTTDVESLLCNSSETADSVDPYYQSSEMGYASANMASQVVPPGPPQPVNYDSCFNDSSASRSVGLELQNILKENFYDVKIVIQAESPSTTSTKTDEHSASGDYSRASYAV